MIYVGTVGEGLWRTDDLGRPWSREPGVPENARIYGLASSPDGQRLYAGGEGVVYRLDRGTWSGLALPRADFQVWALGIHPREPSVVFAGCRPLALLVSEDGGRHWAALGLRLPEGMPQPHTPRVTATLFDAERPEMVWAGVEVGGVFVAHDRGHTWTPINEDLPSLDVHGLALAGDGALLATTPHGVGVYGGDRWAPAACESSDRYFRALTPKPGETATLYAGLGDGPPGTRGTVVISTDNGRTWRGTGFPGARSSVWSLATDPREPDLVVAAAIKGEVFSSRDGGRAWMRAPREFVEVRAVACAA